jgi:hypothetical protein
MPRAYIRRNGRRVRSDESSQIDLPPWVDPYVWIQGSSIEKMVMAELVRRGIYFEHTPQVNPLPWLSWMVKEKNPAKWEPDFLFPQYKIWLEIQGSYWHSLAGAMETDALRFAYIEAVGWKPIAFWEDDIRNRLQDIMNDIPEFYRVDTGKETVAAQKRKTPGLPFWEGGTGIDHLAGLRTALRNRTRPPQGFAKRYAFSRRPK